MNIVNILLILVVLVIGALLVMKIIQKRKNEQVEEAVEVDDKTYNLDKMTAFVKKR